MTALALGLVILQGQRVFVPQGEHDIQGTLTDGTGMYMVYVKPTDAPQLSPQKFGSPPAPWEFFFHTDGYVFENGNKDAVALRFRVFSQTPDRNKTMGKAVALELLVLWRMNHDRLGIDHKLDVNSRVVDVYLCEGGAPGGEQLFETIPGQHGPRQVNSIYIFDVAHFDDRMEQAREVAHEYGHAILTPVGGFNNANGAEYWANGNLGEKLYLRWGRDAMIRRDLQELDFMSTPLVRMDLWIKNHVDPLVKAAALRSPASSLYHGTNRQSFDAFQGIVLWGDSIMPPKMFARSLKLINSYNAKDYDYVASAAAAAGEENYSPQIPKYLENMAVWIPVGAGTVTGGTVQAKKLGWCLVRPHGTLTVHSTPEPG